MSDVLEALNTEALVAILIVIVLCVALFVSIRRRRVSGYKMNARLVKDDTPVPDPHDRTARELPNGGARPIGRLEPTFPTLDNEPLVVEDEQAIGASDEIESQNVSAGKNAEEDNPGLQSGEDVSIAASSTDSIGTLDWLDEIEASPSSGQSAKLSREEASAVYSLNVIARSEHGFSGDEVLRTLLGCGLRFGDMDFFHLSEVQGGGPVIQFSVANMMEPGVFDLEAMGTLSTKGLMFFLTLPGPLEPTRAFDVMLETAHTMAQNLNGDVYDETRSVLTKQYVESLRQSIREYEMKLRHDSGR